MVSGPYLLVVTLLFVAGVSKVIRPLPAVAAVRAMGVPGSAAAVRTLGAIEVGVALLATITGGRGPAVAVAAIYLGFGTFLMLVIREPAAATGCGCFGLEGVQPGWSHVVFDLGAAGVALTAAITERPALPNLVAEQPGFGLPMLMLTGIGVALAHALFTAGPQPRAIENRVASFSLERDL